MNSLNILSARVIRPTPPTPTSSRSRSYSDSNLKQSNSEKQPKRSASQHVKAEVAGPFEERDTLLSSGGIKGSTNNKPIHDGFDEKTPLLAAAEETDYCLKSASSYTKLRLAAERLIAALTGSLRWVLSSITSPVIYSVSSIFYDKGAFSPLLPLQKFGRVLSRRNGRKSTAQAVGLSGSSDPSDHTAAVASAGQGRRKTQQHRRKPMNFELSSTATSESEAEMREKIVVLDSPPEARPRTQSSSSSDDTSQGRRSVRIKLYNEDATRRRKQKKEKDGSRPVVEGSSNEQPPAFTMANIKSPTSPASSLRLTKYPRAPAPPRPLIPRRQPSYSSTIPSRSSRLTQKTLVIDLDETLIHSLAKGGRMSSGHMVEVKLNTAVGYGGATLGPQHPILYYVHKRPHCDEFLRRVYKWYNLIVFTASVQEYADPVIDWLEQERKYFSGRYYRQHCTFRNGAYIKDLSSVEPDLSKVMILDNSPLSYIFHEDNAIPIEGWINDPTDNDLLHLFPLLEALQYVTDVRALLALRRGEMDVSR
ncbi:Nuclear envelope morphology protein 1 [Puttea exsequens]|nr:Nuclear envelope morphology protein 1 [Puttea exsequens]